jgi:AraC family transcriptional activator of pobA
VRKTCLAKSQCHPQAFPIEEVTSVKLRSQNLDNSSPAGAIRRGAAVPAADSLIPRFFLYGEPPRAVSSEFVHLEMLDERSRPANWNIRPHAHADLHHIFHILSGGGDADSDTARVVFAAPCIVAVPAGVVHGFRWIAETEGQVLTFSDALLRTLARREVQIADLFGQGVWASPTQGRSVADALDRLARELGWTAAGHELAVESHLASVLIEALRLRRHVDQEARAPLGPQAQLVARYRELIESDYRTHPAVSALARSLRVTPARLRAACQAVAGASPAQIMHERLMLEAKRVMRYSNMSIAQLGLYLGFEDPAYFTRFFSRRAGVSPRAFRAHAGETKRGRAAPG